MKKLITLLAFMMIGLLVYSQGSPRMVLWEQFTNTSCAPCAGFNPQAEAYWDEHEDEVVAIAYHVWWPGANDPFYLHNVPEQQWRTNLYGCNSVPWATIDGNKFNSNPSMGSIINVIDAQLGVPSPFTIDLSHVKSPTNEEVTVTMDITCSDDISTDMTAYIVVIETVVDFSSPPGNNGETHFTRVFKKFLPDNNGNTLPASMVVDDNVVIEETWTLANFYDHTNLAVVAFVQDNSSKEIYQAAYSAPAGPDYVEPEIFDVVRPVTQICGDEFVPAIVIRNLGGVNLTTLDFEYDVDGGDTYTYTWEGDLAYTDSEEVLLPAISFTPETSNTFNVEILNPNGAPDPNPANNMASVDFEQSTETSMIVEMQLFVGAYASDISWDFYNADGEILESGSGYGTNEIVEMQLPMAYSGCYGFRLYDSSGDGFAGGGYLKLKDDGLVFAYITDELEDIIDIPFNALNPLAAPMDFAATVDAYDISFAWTAPSKATLLGYDIYESADMDTPINSTLIDATEYTFTVDSNGDYEFYLAAVYDEGMSNLVGPVFADINVGIVELENGALNIYPNPVHESATLAFELKENAQVNISVYSLVGSLVFELPSQTLKTGSQSVAINTASLEEGIYFVNLMINGVSITKKITVLK